MNDKETSERGDLLRGALEMLILRTLDEGAMHGFGITEALRARSEEVLAVDEGSMYPALYRMQRRGWIAAEWGRSENNRRAKFYALTDEGRQQLGAASARWDRFSQAVGRVMDTA
ncbi:MAG: PadR family transcriptional regulator [Acidobacteria bacterium]|nr:PadR family transcriptional regulator [Acidobacteriota bacterium]